MIGNILRLFKNKHIHEFTLTKEYLYEEFWVVYKISVITCICGESRRDFKEIDDTEIDIFIRDEKFKELEL